MRIASCSLFLLRLLRPEEGVHVPGGDVGAGQVEGDLREVRALHHGTKMAPGNAVHVGMLLQSENRNLFES